MSGKAWTKPELKKLRQSYENKPAWTTDLQYAQLLAPQFQRSSESIRWQLRQFHREISKEDLQAPKILLLDIETNPIEALVWSTWKQNIYPGQIKKDWSIICWSAKWLFSPTVMGQVVRPDEAIEHKDNSVLMKMWELMNEADWVITHNGDEFDIKKLNTRFFLAGYPRPMYFGSIDTKKVAKGNFSFTYNKLDWIAQIVGIGRKMETEFKWWKECEAGNQAYLDKMLKYNKKDVQLEEEVYLALRPWMTNHPNLNLYADMDGDICPTCGSANIHWNGKYATGKGLYRAFRCEDCGAIGRSTLAKHKLVSSEVQN